MRPAREKRYNSRFESTCYHPLLLFNRDGDRLAAKLRPGHVRSSDDREELLLPEIERQQKRGKEVVLRVDAASAKPEIYETLEERGVEYAIRIPSNDSLERAFAELVTRFLGQVRRPHPLSVHPGRYCRFSQSLASVMFVTRPAAGSYVSFFPARCATNPSSICSIIVPA